VAAPWSLHSARTAGWLRRPRLLINAWDEPRCGQQQHNMLTPSLSDPASPLNFYRPSSTCSYEDWKLSELILTDK
jgi:hypothetical protein